MSTQLVQLKETDLSKVQQEAKQLMQKVSTTDDMQLDVLMDEIGKMGQRTMERASQSLQMLERPVNDLMAGKRTEITNNILKLRNEVDSLSKSKQLGIMDRLLRKVPLKNYIHKYQSVKTNVDAIVGSLRNGRDTLEENIVHMKNLKRSSIEEVYALQARIELGNELKQLFEQEIAQTHDAGRKTHLERGLRKVVTRIQSFTEMIMLYQQAIAGTDIINDNNDKLIDAVEGTIDKTQHLITVSAMISLALQDQMDVIEAVNTANKTIENQFAENARLLRETTQKTSEALTKPAMSLEKINQAMSDLTAAMDMYEQSNRTIIKTATEHTTRMTEMNKQLNDRLGLKAGSQQQSALKEPSITSLLD
ncbi:toxic anion resistance protein [Paenibacillus sp. 481]|uniref:toxic anion resistance protein n=1 Tax=Paenibacillus sp. 481 TaxID=2835869 RepID=UPI001E3BD24E|nr:toxic anion resistance protein [Paenibacillus sp. 481]UHA74795.1 toxic anion resistance protein [Paenibacillus sp. 481]